MLMAAMKPLLRQRNEVRDHYPGKDREYKPCTEEKNEARKWSHVKGML